MIHVYQPAAVPTVRTQTLITWDLSVQQPLKRVQPTVHEHSQQNKDLTGPQISGWSGHSLWNKFTGAEGRCARPTVTVLATDSATH